MRKTTTEVLLTNEDLVNHRVAFRPKGNAEKYGGRKLLGGSLERFRAGVHQGKGGGFGKGENAFAGAG